MKLFGLPGEAAFAFIAAFLLNLYAAIAVLAPLHLTPWQVTRCGLMMGIAHNLAVQGGGVTSPELFRYNEIRKGDRPDGALRVTGCACGWFLLE